MITAILKNIKARGLKDVLNPRKWKVYFQKPPKVEEGEDEASLSYCEQVVYRSILCSSCVKAGECEHCHCEMPSAILSKDNWCSQYKWDVMMSDEQWEDYKKVAKLKFKLDYEN